MEIKKVLNLLANQYSKSFKRFENSYRFNEKVKEFNEGYLKLTSAVLNSGNADKIRASLHNSLIYAWATNSEQATLDEELY